MNSKEILKTLTEINKELKRNLFSMDLADFLDIKTKSSIEVYNTIRKMTGFQRGLLILQKNNKTSIEIKRDILRCQRLIEENYTLLEKINNRKKQ